MKITNYKKIKSSILGFALIAFAGVLLYTGKTNDYWILGSISFTGLMLFFTGDSFIERLEKIVFGHVINLKKENKQ